MICVRRVVGGSMMPTLKEGQIVLGWRKKPRVGSVVIAEADNREVIKRVILIEDGNYHLVGDHPSSADYRVCSKDIKKVVIWPKI